MGIYCHPKWSLIIIILCFGKEIESNWVKGISIHILCKVSPWLAHLYPDLKPLALSSFDSQYSLHWTEKKKKNLFHFHHLFMMVPLSSKVSITCKDVWHFPIVQWHGFRGSTLTTNSIQAATTLGWNPGYLSMGLFFRANEIRVHLGLSKPGPAWPHHNQMWCDLWAGLIQILVEISLDFEILGNMLKVGDYMIINPLYSFKMQPYPTQKYGSLTPIWVNTDDPVLQEGREFI